MLGEQGSQISSLCNWKSPKWKCLHPKNPHKKTTKATSLGGWGGISIALFLFDCAVCSITNREKHTCSRLVILIVAILEALSDVVQRRGILSSRRHQGQPCHCQTRHEKYMGPNSTPFSFRASFILNRDLKLSLRHPYILQQHESWWFKWAPLEILVLRL